MRSSVTWMRSRIQLIQNYLHTSRHYKWKSRAEFVVSCIGYCIGFGNVWRFPYVLYKYGGGTFFLPYVISMIFLSIPMFYLECLLGQFTGCNAIAAFNFAPICRGIGFAMVLIPVYICLYYGVFLVYSFKFMFLSFAHRLPWEVCSSSWGADSRCYDMKPDSVMRNMSKTLPHCSNWAKESKPVINVDCHDRVPASEQYWNRAVIYLEDESGKMYSFEDIGTVQWDLFLALIICWLIQYVVISRGIQSIAKFAYFTTILPFIIIISLVINAVQLNGFLTGLEYLFTPEWRQLANADLWQEAVCQAFFSTGICFGCTILYSSYNKFHAKLFRSVIFIVLMDFIASTLSAILIFSVLGHLAEHLHRNIENVVDAGPGLIFVVMPGAFTQMPIPQFWCFLYFFMIFGVGINSQAAQLDTFLTCIHEEIHRLKYHLNTIRLCACCFMFTLSIPFVTNAGILMVAFLDHFIVKISLLFLAMCEIIALLYIYKMKNFYYDLEFMLHYKIHWIWTVSWGIFCPLIFLVVLILGIAFSSICENYSRNVCIGGWIISIFTIIHIPIAAMYYLFKNFRTQVGIKGAFKPIYTWGPREVINKVLYLEWQRQRGVPLGMRTTTGLAELESEGCDVKTEAENRIRQRKLSVFYRFSQVFLPEELEEMERESINVPHTPRFVSSDPTTSR